MTPLLEYEGRRSVDGYKIVSLDQRKFHREMEDDLAWVFKPPIDPTDDERRIMELLGGGAWPSSLEEPGVVQYVVPQSNKFENFNLFKSAPAAFHELAHTPTTSKGVQAFADRYGLLRSRPAELVVNWYRSIRRMRRAIAAWKKARESGDFKKVARLVNKQGGSDTGIPVDAKLKAVPPVGAAKICIRPFYLEHALWMQLSLAIDGTQNFGSCVECGAWFQLDAGGGRSDKTYCTDACRMRAYRKRKKGER